MTREPEQVRAFRDTWRDGIHSYLTYLKDRMMVARELLLPSGAIFLQIGDENVHRVRAMMDEVFGDDNFVALITIEKTSVQTSQLLSLSTDYILFYARSKESLKFRNMFVKKKATASMRQEYSSYEDPQLLRKSVSSNAGASEWSRLESTYKVFAKDNMTSSKPPGSFPVSFRGQSYLPGNSFWKTGEIGLSRLIMANRIEPRGTSLRYVRYFRDYGVSPINNIWTDVRFSSRRESKIYVVQSSSLLIQRCVLMTTDPGDLVLDPTCGSGTAAYVSEQWGRRWITIDTSRIALALARARLMAARYPYYFLADSRRGQLKEAEITRKSPSETSTFGNVRQGFVCERIPHIMLSDIANNSEIEVIWEQFQKILNPLLAELNLVLDESWEEWEVPHQTDDAWPPKAHDLHRQWWHNRIKRQEEIDASILARLDPEYLYDKPYEDKSKVRVAGPFTVESLSPHRTLTVAEDEELLDLSQANEIAEPAAPYDLDDPADFARMVLDNLKTSGVQQAHKEDRITFTAITGWPGRYICAEARYFEGEATSGREKRAGIFIGPEFGTVSRSDLVAAAREAGDADFDVVIACAFNFDAHSADFDKLGRIPILKARMNADLHMANDLKNTGQGNLFVIFGEPDIDLFPAEGKDAKEGQIQVRINGVDVFDPQTGEVRSDSADGIACWFIDTDYNEESFFVRHAYFLGAGDPYKSLKTTLKAEIDPEAWATLHSDTSRPFDKPASGRIAVKVINHLGDEVMKVYRVR